MILAILACFFGLLIGIMAFINYSSFGAFNKTFAAGILYFISCECAVSVDLPVNCLLGQLLLQVICYDTFFSGFFVLLAMAIYTGVTVNYYGKRYGNWRFSWSYIMGWVSVVLTFFSGIAYFRNIQHKCGQIQCLVYKVVNCCFFAGMFYMCAFRMHAPIGPMSR